LSSSLQPIKTALTLEFIYISLGASIVWFPILKVPLINPFSFDKNGFSSILMVKLGYFVFIVKLA